MTITPDELKEIRKKQRSHEDLSKLFIRAIDANLDLGLTTVFFSELIEQEVAKLIITHYVKAGWKIKHGLTTVINFGITYFFQFRDV